MPSTLTNCYGFSSTFSNCWLRTTEDIGPVITALKSVRDFDNDAQRVVTEHYMVQSSDASSPPGGLGFLSLNLLQSAAVPTMASTIVSASPSGRYIFSGSVGKDDHPILEVNGAETIFRVDGYSKHGKIMGDSWFGGCSWSYDERYVMYVANTKESKSSTSFEATATTNVAAMSSVIESTASATEASSTSIRGEKSEKESEKESKFAYREAWGEKFETVRSLVICILDITTGEIFTLPSLSEDFTMGAPVFSTTDYSIVYTAWNNLPRRLGMIYCYQRPCALYHVNLTEFLANVEANQVQHTPLTSTLALARSARFSPDGKYLVFIGREKRLASHNGCFQLYKLPIDSIVIDGTPACQVVLDTVYNPDKDAFPGLFTDQLPRNCYLSDDMIALNTCWGSCDAIVTVNISTGVVSRLDDLGMILAESEDELRNDSDWNNLKDASCSLLDVHNGHILYTASSPNTPNRLGLVHASSGLRWRAARAKAVGTNFKFRVGSSSRSSDTSSGSTSGSISDSSISSSSSSSSIGDIKSLLQGMLWKTFDFKSPQGIPYQATLLLPPSASPHSPTVPSLDSPDAPSHTDAQGSIKVPLTPPLPSLLVSPHGGPHSVFPTAFFASYAYLSLKLNTAILSVNYRGSTGFGQDSVDSLLGNIGVNDVNDCIHSMRHIISLGLVDGSRVGVVGGSHGGFLTGHLIGQYPDLFRAAAMRNPVTNIPAMVSTSDIPDWCYVEATGSDSYDFDKFQACTPDILVRMYECSPVAHVSKVTTPTIIALGLADKRVPSSQGIEYYHFLRAKGIPAKLLIFPDDVHAIDKPLSEAEHWIAISDWFQKYL